MPVTLLLAGLRVPADVAAAVVPTLQVPALRSALARATRAELSSHTRAPHVDWIAQHVFGRAEYAGAPFAYAALTGRAPPIGSTVWHADPIHLDVARDHLAAAPLIPAPSDDEAEALLEVANALARDADVRFERAGRAWFAHTPTEWQVDTVPLDALWGRPLHDVLPGGRDAALWSRLLNEIQMAWHLHPANTAREDRGEPTINGLWLHGGGDWARPSTLAYTALAADLPELIGAAQAAGVVTLPPAAPWRDGMLAVWTDALAPRALHDWPAWQSAVEAVDARLGERARSTSIQFVLTGQRSALRLNWRPADRLKFWRSRPLEEALSE